MSNELIQGIRPVEPQAESKPEFDPKAPLPGEDEHRPFDLATMRPVLPLKPEELVAFQHENGRIEVMSKDTQKTRLAQVKSKEIYRTSTGELLEGYVTDKGVIIHNAKLATPHKLHDDKAPTFEQQFKKL